MNPSTTLQVSDERPARVKLDIESLVGSGDKIGPVVLPFIVVGLALNIWRPAFFGVGGPSDVLRAVSAVLLVPGVVIWLWSVVLILTKVPRRELITNGPFALVKHPLYTGVALLVLPWVGILLNSWLGAVLGIVLYVASRFFAPEEERALAKAFGARWDEYARRVLLPWV